MQNEPRQKTKLRTIKIVVEKVRLCAVRNDLQEIHIRYKDTDYALDLDLDNNKPVFRKLDKQDLDYGCLIVIDQIIV